VYRLADKLDLPALKLRAFQHIIAGVTAQNIPAEVFSRFSSTFEDVRKVSGTRIDVLRRVLLCNCDVGEWEEGAVWFERSRDLGVGKCASVQVCKCASVQVCKCASGEVVKCWMARPVNWTTTDQVMPDTQLRRTPNRGEMPE
jgi:hypothetical protein